MLETDLAARAQLILLPRPVGAVRAPTTRHGMTVGEAIRHVVEDVPAEERARAVVRTPTRLLFIAEIEALFDRMRQGTAPSSNRRRNGSH
jgi:hypothetical protein